jgi:DNA-binding LacI/PurR family transcriptional regulator
MGAAAAQLLFARIAGDISPARELIFKPQLLIRW